MYWSSVFGGKDETGIYVCMSPGQSLFRNIEDSSGVKIGEASAVSNNVASGQTAIEDAVGTASGSPTSVTCKVANVDRLAS